MFGMLVTLLVSALVLIFAGYLIPGLTVFGFGGALKAAVVIAVLAFFVEKMLGKKASPQGRGLAAFLSGALVIYLSQFIIPDSVEATVAGALIASFVIGAIDAVLPTAIR